uniref:Uncharacterized protein n=1 Tax=Arundo donax TaxID=35708 RepID=A0A0A9AET4_ARUDO
MIIISVSFELNYLATKWRFYYSQMALKTKAELLVLCFLHLVTEQQKNREGRCKVG